METRLCDSLAFQDCQTSARFSTKPLRIPHLIGVEPTTGVVDITSHPTLTLVDVQTRRLGLPFMICCGPLARRKFISELSRITTAMDVAMDTFYVTDGQGKITDESAIKRSALVQRAARSFREVGGGLPR